MDRSNGYQGVSEEFLARRGSGRSTGIGVNEVRKWARTLGRGATVIDLGCGPGFPITEVLVAEGLNAFGVDAAPSKRASESMYCLSTSTKYPVRRAIIGIVAQLTASSGATPQRSETTASLADSVSRGD